MLERHLALAHALRHAAVARVEALEPRLAVVVAVGVVEVEQQLAAQLDLVGRVVGEEPGRGGVAQPELEQRRGRGEQQRRRRGRAPRPAQPASARAARSAGQRGARRTAARRANAPPAGCPGPTPRPPRAPAARADPAGRPRRAGRARIRAELRQRDRHEHEQHAHERPGPAPSVARDDARLAGACRCTRRLRRARPLRRAPRSRRRCASLPGQPARRHAEHEPGDRVLEEAAVEQRVHEQREEATRRSARPERLVARGRPRRSAARRPTSSQTYSASPITPSSAATVSGVVCETKFGVGRSLPRQLAARARLPADAHARPAGRPRSRARCPPRARCGRW